MVVGRGDGRAWVALQARGITGLARSTTVAAAVVAMAFGVAGCTGAGEGSDGRSRSVSADGASTPGASTPAGGASDGGGDSPTEEGGASAGIPEENKDLKPPVFDDYPGITENTDEGAEQTLKYFFDAMYYGYATGDTGPMNRVVDLSKCKSCATVTSRMEDMNARGEFAIPGDSEVTDLSVVSQLDSGEREVLIIFDRSGSGTMLADGTKKTMPNTSVAGAAKMGYKEGKWVINRASWKDLM